MSSKGILIISLAAAFVPAVLTWVVTIGASNVAWDGAWLDYVGPMIMLPLVPGFIASIIFSNNVHNFSIWVAVSGNFLFYIGVVYMLLRSRAKRKVSHTAI